MFYKYIVLGGDERLSVCSDILFKSGRNVSHIYPAGKTNADALNAKCGDFLILPVPVSRDNVNLNVSQGCGNIPLTALTEYVCDGGTVYGGKITDELKEIFKSKNVSFVDFMEIEEFTMKNAHMTAEGAVGYLMANSKKALSDMKILIVGLGRIGKFLAHILKSYDSDITVSGRSDKDVYLWKELGYKSLKTDEIWEYFGDYDAVFNTVPYPVINDDFIKKVKKTCIITDLASAPGGTDFSSAKEHGIKAVNLLGVPGKYFPLSSGELLAELVIRKEREYDERRN